MRQTFEHGTWIQNEEFAYPHGGMTRKGRAVVMPNPHNPRTVPLGTVRAIRAGIPDTYFTIPATITVKGRRVRGHVSLNQDMPGAAGSVLVWTANANPDACQRCAAGEGCKKGNR